MAKTGTRNYSTRGTGSMLGCQHAAVYRNRLKAGVSVLESDGPGLWMCSLCHPNAELDRRGMLEWWDGRETPEPDPPGPNDPETILRCIGRKRIVSAAPTLVAPVPSEAKGQVTMSRPPQPPSSPAQRKKGTVKAAAPARKNTKKTPPPPSPSLF